MLEGVIKDLQQIEAFGHTFDGREAMESVLSVARENAMLCGRRVLLEEVKNAIAATPEYQYPVLASHLLNNLKDPIHIWISEDLRSVNAVDEDIAGDETDFLQGQMAAWKTASGTPENRLFVWKYGIYRPGREGGELRSKFEYLPSYKEIIDIRLNTWGYKAPYWSFLNYGSTLSAYPSFPGTNFKERTEYKLLNECIPDAVDDAVRQFTRSIPAIRVITQYGARIGTWYQLQIGGVFKGRIFPGQTIPGTGEVFNP